MNAAQNIEVAEEVAALLEQAGSPAVVIGAIALAAHGYVTETQDLDVGTNAPLEQLRSVSKTLKSRGYDVALHLPDGDDPLGGVLDVSGSFGLVQVVSFATTFPRVISDAIADATHFIAPGSSLRLVPLEQLVALKLYAGGYKSLADVAELLARNPDVDLERLNDVCKRYRLDGKLRALLSASSH